MHSVLPLFALLLATGPAGAEPSPPVGRLVEGVGCAADPSQTYTLYLPTAFTPERRWPVLLIFDPRGRSAMAAELFRDAAETYGWVVLSSNDTRSDGPMEPNRKALAALWPEVHSRYSIDPERIYAAGFSGGAMLAWLLGRGGGLAGVIGSGGRFGPGDADEKLDFPCFGAAGDTDFNYAPMRRVHARLEEWGTPNRLEIFEGRHRWMPAELATAGVEWMELMAMKRGLRPVDDALVEALHRQDVAAALALQTANEGLAAMRRFRAIASTFEGLRDVAGERQMAARLAARAEVKAAIAEEKRWDDYEAAYRRDRMGPAFSRLAPGSPTTASRLAADLRLAELKERAEAEGYEGVVARRLLNTVFTHTSFYLARDAFARRDHRTAVAVLTVAGEIWAGWHRVWYDLGRAHALDGSKKKALAALERAVEAGFGDGEKLATDPDLESLRRTDGFQRLVSRLGG